MHHSALLTPKPALRGAARTATENEKTRARNQPDAPPLPALTPPPRRAEPGPGGASSGSRGSSAWEPRPAEGARDAARTATLGLQPPLPPLTATAMVPLPAPARPAPEPHKPTAHPSTSSRQPAPAPSRSGRTAASPGPSARAGDRAQEEEVVQPSPRPTQRRRCPAAASMGSLRERCARVRDGAAAGWGGGGSPGKRAVRCAWGVLPNPLWWSATPLCLS